MPALSFTMLNQRRTTTNMSSGNDNTSQAWQIIAFTGSWCFLALVVVCMRIYTRTVMVKYFGWDDVATVVTMILGLAIFACFVGEAHWALGQHRENISHLEWEMYSKYQFAHSMLLVWALQGMKIAFMLFLVRLSVGRVYRATLYAVVGFMTLYTMINWLMILLACTPISANWTMKGARCLSVTVYTGLGLSNSIFGMITDALLALIPIPIVSQLQLNWRAKACLIVAFGMGMITVACGAIKTYYQFHFLDNADRLYQDAYFVWGALELYVGIMAASLVSLKPLLGSFLDKAKTTLATSAALAKSLHHHGSPRLHSPRLDEKSLFSNQQFDTQNFPKIEVCSFHSYDGNGFTDLPMNRTRPRLSPLSSNPRKQASPRMANLPFQRPKVPKAKKPKKRPAPLDTKALSRGNSIEAPSVGGVIVSPSPTFLPSGESLNFFNLIRGLSPETIQENQSLPPTAAPTPTTSTTPNPVRPTLAALCKPGILTSPSPTYLPPDADLNFFDLIRGRDPETIARETASRPTTISSLRSYKSSRASRRGTLMSMRTSKWLSGDFSEATAMVQTVKKVTAGEVRRRPSMAPSATSAYLCPPVQDTFRESQMIFHVIPAGQFPNPQTATVLSSSPESPLSPLSVTRERQLSDLSVVSSGDGGCGGVEDGDGDLEPVVARERQDSSEMLIRKEG